MEYIKSEGLSLVRVMVCSPEKEYFNIKNTDEHNISEIPDPEKAKKQHEMLRETMIGFGVDVIDIPEMPGHPNSVFTRDTAVITPRGYIRMRMGLPSRRNEGKWIESHLEEMCIPCAGEIEPPGTAEGGDVILAGKVAFVGMSGRTNFEGVIQLTKILESMGYQVRTTEVPTPYLHLGGAMSMVAPGRILSVEGIFSSPFFAEFEVINIAPGDFVSGNVICLKENRVIAHDGNQMAISKLEKFGVKVEAVDLSEFIRGNGGPTCLIMPLERRE
ncbi:MAG: amidinotransferase [Candidatus Eremiobacteraeota bacterium]|nr:amidinotransferase [Candidatus Eremiobacteraeota bacterium]